MPNGSRPSAPYTNSRCRVGGSAGPPAGNIVNVARTTVRANQISILNVTPINTVGGWTSLGDLYVQMGKPGEAYRQMGRTDRSVRYARNGLPAARAG